MTVADVDAVLAELAALEDPRMRAVNERHGDDHGVNLTKLRELAKALGPRTDLVQPLWDTGHTAARLVAILLAKPAAFSAADLDRMLRQARAPKTRDWLVSYVVKKSRHREELRHSWLADDEPAVAAAGWALTADAVAKSAAPGDLDALLDTIEAELADAPEDEQWQMNTCLAMIGIHHPSHRARAVAIGERLRVLEDYPTPPNCTSPYAPAWIAEMVRRQGGSA